MTSGQARLTGWAPAQSPTHAQVRQAMNDSSNADELARNSAALTDALREAYGLAQAGEFGQRAHEALHVARDPVALAGETLAADPRSANTRAAWRGTGPSSWPGAILGTWK